MCRNSRNFIAGRSKTLRGNRHEDPPLRLGGAGHRCGGCRALGRQDVLFRIPTSAPTRTARASRRSVTGSTRGPIRSNRRTARPNKNSPGGRSPRERQGVARAGQRDRAALPVPRLPATRSHSQHGRCPLASGTRELGDFPKWLRATRNCDDHLARRPAASLAIEDVRRHGRLRGRRRAARSICPASTGNSSASIGSRASSSGPTARSRAPTRTISLRASRRPRPSASTRSTWATKRGTCTRSIARTAN